jgi:serine/threonine protein kinase
MTDTTNPGEGRLQTVLASVCDNLPVDWDEENERATPLDKPLIRSLRELSQVAERNAGFLATAAEFPEPGQYGRLELLAVLGSGTHGRVYHARDLLLDRDVAVKVLDTHAEDEVRLQEARRLASIRHPNVVTIHDVAAVAGRAALVMERLHGESLDRYAAEQGPLDATIIASIGADLAGALGAVHASGLVHRDVKAQNVMREPSGRIVLMDLGPGLGTPRTMAPEVFSGRPPTPASDIYSLGVLLLPPCMRRVSRRRRDSEGTASGPSRRDCGSS